MQQGNLVISLCLFEDVLDMVFNSFACDEELG